MLGLYLVPQNRIREVDTFMVVPTKSMDFYVKKCFEPVK